MSAHRKRVQGIAQVPRLQVLEPMCRLQISVTVQPTDFRRWFSCVPQLEPVEWLASMKLLAQWLGIFLLAFLAGGCRGALPTPTAPTVITITTPAAPAPPTATTPQFSIVIGANGGQTFTDTEWQTSVVVSGSTTPSRVTVNCNNGAPLQEYAGFSGAKIVSCAFPAAGDYPVVATALTGGFSTTDRTTVTASVRPVPPPPPPSPPPSPTRLNVSVSCTPKPAKTDTPCNVTATYGNAVVTSNLNDVRWDFGDGDTQVTAKPFTSHDYPQSGTYRLTINTSYAGNDGEASTTVVIP